MGPAVFMTNAWNPIFQIAEWANSIEIIFHLFGFHEFLPHMDVVSALAHYFCNIIDHPVYGELCENIIFALSGINEAQLNMYVLRHFHHVPQY